MGVFHIAREFLFMSEELGLALAIEISILWNFLINRSWTWADRKSHFGKQFTLYHLSVSLGATLNWGGAYLLMKQFSWHADVSNFCGIALGTIANYLLNDRMTFGGKN